MDTILEFVTRPDVRSKKSEKDIGKLINLSLDLLQSGFSCSHAVKDIGGRPILIRGPK